MSMVLALICLPCFIVHFANAIQVKASHEKAKADGRPNILFLMTDSMDGRVVDPLSHQSKAVDLPFVRDFFASNGANFVQSYSNNPVCVPSRSSMMTGRRSDQLGVWGLSDGLASAPNGVLDDKCVDEYGKAFCTKRANDQGSPEHILSVFKKLGYNVHMDGRLHIGGGILNAVPHSEQFDGHQTCDGFSRTMPEDMYRSSDARIAPGDMYRSVFLGQVSETGGDDVGWGASDWGNVNLCTQFIDDLPTPSESTQPFFLHCSFSLPHYDYSTNSTWLRNVHANKIVLPVWREGFPDTYHPYDSYMITAKGLDKPVSEGEMLKLIKVYYGMVAEADAMLQRVWNALTEKGYGLDNTYVVHVSDHGEMKFEHRQVFKASMYEGSVRVPLQIAGPGIAKGQRFDSHLTSLLDVFPTLLDMAQVDTANQYGNLAGQSLLEVAGGKSVAPAANKLPAGADTRDFVMSQYNWVQSNTGSVMVRSGHWKLITFGRTYSQYKNYTAQLFDVQKDPDEQHDIAAENPDVVTKLEKRLRQDMDPDAVDRRVKEVNFAALEGLCDGNIQSSCLIIKQLEHFFPTEFVTGFQEWVNESRELFSSTPPLTLARMRDFSEHGETGVLGNKL